MPPATAEAETEPRVARRFDLADRLDDREPPEPVSESQIDEDDLQVASWLEYRYRVAAAALGTFWAALPLAGFTIHPGAGFAGLAVSSIVVALLLGAAS